MKLFIKNSRVLYIVLAALILAGCGEETVDGSSAAKLDNSLQSISQNISIDKKESFDGAIQTIKRRYRSQPEFAKNIDGMNADEIISKGKDVEKELAAFRKNQLEEYKASIVNNYKAAIASTQNQIQEEQNKTGSLAEFMKDRYEAKIKLQTESKEKFENMSAEEFETYAKDKGWQPDYSKI